MAGSDWPGWWKLRMAKGLKSSLEAAGVLVETTHSLGLMGKPRGMQAGPRGSVNVIKILLSYQIPK